MTTGNTDTIASILLRYASTGVTYNSFLNCNPGVWAYVNYYYLPAGLTLCIPTTSYSIGYNYPYFYYNWYNYYPYNTYYTCSKAYVVVSGDICYSIVSRLGINLAYLYVCNPSINSGCTNLQPGKILNLLFNKPSSLYIILFFKVKYYDTKLEIVKNVENKIVYSKLSFLIHFHDQSMI